MYNNSMNGTKYPIILAHGIVLKDVAFFKAFGRIQKSLGRAGYCVQTAKTDGFGLIETNAAQLKAFIEGVCEREHAEKVNIIAHSKGGLDAKYMIERLGMADRVASLTTLCTPHRGSPVASWLLRLPKLIRRFVAFWINLWYRIFGDKKPNALGVCRQLRETPANETAALAFSDKVYCQSYSTTLEKGRDDFVMGIPLMLSRHMEKLPSDGLVSVESARFGEYRGSCVDESVSHSEIVDFMAGKKKREKIHVFYLQLCGELAEKGF